MNDISSLEPTGKMSVLNSKWKYSHAFGLSRMDDNKVSRMRQKVIFVPENIFRPTGMKGIIFVTSDNAGFKSAFLVEYILRKGKKPPDPACETGISLQALHIEMRIIFLTSRWKEPED
jgi:hypothetical protein